MLACVCAGLTQFIPGLGERSLRYSMYLEDGVVKVRARYSWEWGVQVGTACRDGDDGEEIRQAEHPGVTQ